MSDETQLDFELTARRQLGYLIKTINNSKNWASEKLEEGEMDLETRDSMLLLGELWTQSLRQVFNDFLDEYYPEEEE